MAQALLGGPLIGRLLWPRKVSRKRFSFHVWGSCLRTEILRELILYKKLNSNPKSSRTLDLQFSHKLLFYLHQFYDKFFHCSTSRIDEDTWLHSSEWLIPVNQSLHLTKDRFVWIILSYVILSALAVNNITCQQLWQGTDIAL